MNFLSKLKIEEIKHGTARKGWSRSMIASTLSIVGGLIIALLIATAIGYNPFQVISGLFSVGFNDPITLFFEFGILAIAGFSFAFAARAGIFNIGISGQMLAAGTMVVFVTSVWIPLDSVSNGAGQIITLLVAIITGSLIALFTGLLETFLKVNSVVTAIILNWIIYFITFYFLSQDNANPTMAGSVIIGSAMIPDNFRFWDLSLIPSIPSLIPILLTVFILGIIIFILFKFTVYGHKIKATGLSIQASSFAGYNVKLVKLSAFAISGAIAGILGIILYTSGRSANIPLTVFSDFLPIEGFNGIAIALIAFNNPIGIISVSALIGLFKTSVTGIFLNESGSYINLLIGLLLMGAALSAVISELRPILKYQTWKYGKDIAKAVDIKDNELNKLIGKYRTLYKNYKKQIKISNENYKKQIKISNEKWGIIAFQLNEDYKKEKYFYKESYKISKIYSWIFSSKNKIKENFSHKNKILQEISKIRNTDAKKDLIQALGGN